MKGKSVKWQCFIPLSNHPIPLVGLCQLPKDGFQRPVEFGYPTLVDYNLKPSSCRMLYPIYAYIPKYNVKIRKNSNYWVILFIEMRCSTLSSTSTIWTQPHYNFFFCLLLNYEIMHTLYIKWTILSNNLLALSLIFLSIITLFTQIIIIQLMQQMTM